MWFFFSCTLLTSNNMISRVVSTCKFFKNYKLHLPHGLVQFCCLWKIYKCLLTPNKHRNHVITNTKEDNSLRAGHLVERSWFETYPVIVYWSWAKHLNLTESLSTRSKMGPGKLSGKADEFSGGGGEAIVMIWLFLAGSSQHCNFV